MDFTEKPSLGLYDPNAYFDKHNAPFDVAAHTHYICEAGSHAYGTNTPSSDLDLRGVVIPPLDLVFGLNNFEQITNQDEKEGQGFRNDVCFYSLKKFVLLGYKNGPHILEMLHCDPKSVKYSSDTMNRLLEHKDKFLSNQLQYSFGGYAYTQLMTMRTKKANNTGRKHLIEAYGYDAKMLQHCIRLFRMGTNVVLTGKLEVLRPDAEELLAIRNGKYSYEEAVVFDESAKKPTLVGGIAFDEQQKFMEACTKSVLPDHPDFNFINNLLVQIQQDYYLSGHNNSKESVREQIRGGNFSGL